MVTPGSAMVRRTSDQVVIFGDLEGQSAAALSERGWHVTLARPDGADLGHVPKDVQTVLYDGDTVPIPDGQANLLMLVDALEFAVDDAALLTEARRILRGDGSLIVRVPLSGRLAWLDARNIHQYVKETTGRGGSLPEMADVSFRRHYERHDVKHLLTEAGFSIQSDRPSALGLSELVYLGGMAAFRWLRQDRRFAGWRRAYASLDRLETRSRLGGYYLTIRARRNL